ncbi:helix-turn-helix domain-containing protein [Paraburkholderia sediminicola]|uniref:helix-turn-helix domain-containing protein n=1 Tax=Paraburkholderia sediminicola TaxID=458836 RepID=UPI0038B84B3F
MWRVRRVLSSANSGSSTDFCPSASSRTDSKIASNRKLLTSGMPPRKVARNLGVSIATLYRCVPASALPYHHP